jgi:predicted kinase
VRAKVGLFRLHQPGLSASEKSEIHEHYLHGMALADQYMQDSKPKLVITYGVSGSGKSTRARQLVEQLGAVQIRSDTERKRLAGLAANSNSNSALNQGLYTEANNEKVYQHLLESARSIIQSKFTVVVDATFLQAKYRLWFRELAAELNIPFHIQLCYLPTDILKTRIVDRKIQQNNDEPSEARLEVLAMQEASLEPLTDQELSYASGDVSGVICYN